MKRVSLFLLGSLLAVTSVTGVASASTEAEVIATIPVGPTPFGIGVTPDGSRVYVSNSTGGSVSVIDTTTYAVTSTITSNVGTTPVGITIDASGTYAYVANYGAGTVTRITVSSGATSSIDIDAAVGGVCLNLLNIALTPNGATLYAACQDQSRVISAPVAGGVGTVWMSEALTFPTDVALSADGTTVVSSLSGNTRNQAYILDGTGSHFVSVTTGPYAVALSPTTGLAYLAGQTSGAVSVVNTVTRSVASTFTVGGSLSDIAITPDGSTALVSVLDQDVVRMVNLSTGSVTATIPVGDGPQSVTISRDGRYAYTANRNANTVSVIRLPETPGSGAQASDVQIYELTLAAGDGARCTTTQIFTERGLWTNLPEASACTPAAETPDAVLLGWATTDDFPREHAQRQVTNGWGAFETFNEDGDLTAVFIPAGQATLSTGSRTLFAVWSE